MTLCWLRWHWGKGWLRPLLASFDISLKLGGRGPNQRLSSRSEQEYHSEY